MRSPKIIDEVHALPGDKYGKGHEMICIQLIKFTYWQWNRLIKKKKNLKQ